MSNYQPTLAKLPKGVELPHDPSLNKGPSFTVEERDALGLRGLLPPRIFSQAERARHVMQNIRSKENNLAKYLYLIGLQDRNERLFYRALIDNMAELSPIVYTPTVGLACQKYSRIFRRPHGLFISKYDRNRIKGRLQNWPNRVRKAGIAATPPSGLRTQGVCRAATRAKYVCAMVPESSQPLR